MKTTIYWTGRHLQRTVHDIRFAAKLWWMNQQVDFLDWRGQLQALLPSSPYTPIPQPTKQGGRHAMQSLPLLHG